MKDQQGLKVAVAVFGVLAILSGVLGYVAYSGSQTIKGDQIEAQAVGVDQLDDELAVGIKFSGNDTVFGAVLYPGEEGKKMGGQVLGVSDTAEGANLVVDAGSSATITDLTDRVDELESRVSEVGNTTGTTGTGTTGTGTTVVTNPTTYVNNTVGAGPESIGTLQIKEGDVNWHDMRIWAVGTEYITPHAITSDQLSEDAVGTFAIQDGSVTGDKINPYTDLTVDDTTTGTLAADGTLYVDETGIGPNGETVGVIGGLYVTAGVNATDMLLEPVADGDTAIDVRDTSGASSFLVDENGNLFGANIQPTADSTYDLGALGNEWANIYVDTIIATDLTVDTLTVNTESFHNGPEHFYDIIDAQGTIVNSDTGMVVVDDSLEVAADAIVHGGLDAQTTITNSITDIVVVDDNLEVTGDVWIDGNLAVDGESYHYGPEYYYDSINLIGTDTFTALFYGNEYSYIDHYGDADIGDYGKDVALWGAIDFFPDVVTTNYGNYYNLGDITVDGDTYLNGYVYLGDDTSDLLYANGRFATDLVPESNGMYSIGLPNYRWSDGFFSDTVRVGVAGLQTVLRDNGLRTVGQDMRLVTDGGGNYNIVLAPEHNVVLRPGNEKVRSAADIIPTMDLTYDLGKPWSRWNNVYTGNVYTEYLTVYAESEHYGPEHYYDDIDAQDRIVNLGTANNGHVLVDDRLLVPVSIGSGSTAPGQQLIVADNDGFLVEHYGSGTDWFEVDAAGDTIVHNDLYVYGESFHSSPEHYYDDIDAQDRIYNSIGDVIIDDNLFPGVDDMYLLGDPNNRWMAGFFSQGVAVGDINGSGTISGIVPGAVGSIGMDIILGTMGGYDVELWPSSNYTYSYGHVVPQGGSWDLGTGMDRWNSGYYSNSVQVGMPGNQTGVLNNAIQKVGGALTIRTTAGGGNIFLVPQTGIVDIRADVLPSTTLAYNLGSAAREWANLFVDTITATTINTDYLNVYEDTVLGTDATDTIDIQGAIYNSNPAANSGYVMVDDRLLVTDSIGSGDADPLIFGDSHGFDFRSDGNTFVTMRNGVPEAGPMASHYEVSINGDLEVTGTIDPTAIYFQPIGDGQDVIEVRDSLDTADVFLVTEDGNVYAANTIRSAVDVRADNNVRALNNVTADVNLTVGNNATISNNVSVGNTLSVSGNTLLGDALGDIVVYNARINSDVVPNAHQTFDLGAAGLEWDEIYADDFIGCLSVAVGGSTYCDDAYITGTLDVDGATTLNDVLTVQAASDFYGDMTLHGSNFFRGDVDSAIDHDGDADIGSAGKGVYLYGDVQFYPMGQPTTNNGDLDNTGNLTVDGATTLNGTVDLGDAAADTISVNGRINTNIIPTGSRNLGSGSNGWNTVYAATIMNGTASDTNYVSVNDRLHVTGSIGSGEANPLYLRDDQGIAVQDYTTETTVFAVDPLGNAASTGKHVAVIGDLYVSGSIDPTDIILTPADDAVAIQVNSVAAVPVFTVDENGDVDATDITADNMTLTGALGLANLNVTGNLDVNGATTLDGVTVDDDIATLNAGVTITGGMTVNGATTLKDGATIEDGMTVSGGATVSGNVDLNNELNVDGNTTVRSIDIQGKIVNSTGQPVTVQAGGGFEIENSGTANAVFSVDDDGNVTIAGNNISATSATISVSSIQAAGLGQFGYVSTTSTGNDNTFVGDVVVRSNVAPAGAEVLRIDQSNGSITAAGGTFTAASFINGGLSITGGNIIGAGSIGAVSLTASGAVSAGSFTTAGALSAGSITTSGALSAASITTGGALTAGSITTAGALSAGSATVGGSTVLTDADLQRGMGTCAAGTVVVNYPAAFGVAPIITATPINTVNTRVTVSGVTASQFTAYCSGDVNSSFYWMAIEP